ncbi:MAG: hypothetical protein J6Y94_06680, partial [Bacteriovoracaceae bacterium]|nr:hypothetical protein [Bacteriovoracaceae bacterium]
PDHKSGKRDFFIIATDTSVKNGFGITGGIEFFNPADAFKFLDTSKLSLEEIPTNCPSGVR